MSGRRLFASLVFCMLLVFSSTRGLCAKKKTPAQVLKFACCVCYYMQYCGVICPSLEKLWWRRHYVAHTIPAEKR